MWCVDEIVLWVGLVGSVHLLNVGKCAFEKMEVFQSDCPINLVKVLTKTVLVEISTSKLLQIVPIKFNAKLSPIINQIRKGMQNPFIRFIAQQFCGLEGMKNGILHYVIVCAIQESSSCLEFAHAYNTVLNAFLPCTVLLLNILCIQNNLFIQFFISIGELMS